MSGESESENIGGQVPHLPPEKMVLPVVDDYAVKRGNTGGFYRSDRVKWEDFLESVVKGSKEARGEYEKARRDGFAGTGDDLDRAEASGAEFGIPMSVAEALAQEESSSVNDRLLEELALREERSKIGPQGSDIQSHEDGTASEFLDERGDGGGGTDDDDFPEDPFRPLDDSDAPASHGTFVDDVDPSARDRDADSDSGIGGVTDDTDDSDVREPSVPELPEPEDLASGTHGAVTLAQAQRPLVLSELIPQSPGDDPARVPIPRDETLREMREAMNRMAEQNRLVSAQLEASERRADSNDRKFAELMAFVEKVLSGNDNQRPIVVKVEMPAGVSVPERATDGTLVPEPSPKLTAPKVTVSQGDDEPTTRSGVKGHGTHYVPAISIGVIPKASGDLPTSMDPEPAAAMPAYTEPKRASAPMGTGEGPAGPADAGRRLVAAWDSIPSALKVAAVILITISIFFGGLWAGGGLGDRQQVGDDDLVQKAVAQKFYFVRNEMRELDEVASQPERIKSEMLTAVKAGEGEDSPRLRELNAKLVSAERDAVRAREAKTALIRMTGVQDGGHRENGGAL